MKNFLNLFGGLSSQNKKLLFIMQIFFIGNIIAGTFVNIYVYRIFNTIESLILYNVLFYIFTVVSFIVIGFICSKWKFNMKWSYPISYVFFILAFGSLLFVKDPNIIYVFCLLYGFGNGFIGCANHVYELSTISEKNRPFYSGISTTLRNTWTIFIPFFVSLIFIFSEFFVPDFAYNILFIFVILSYFVSFYFVKGLDDFFPAQTGVKKIFMKLEKKDFYQNMFFMFAAQTSTVPKLVGVILVIYLLKNEINIGLFQTVIGVLGVLLTGFVTTKKNNTNALNFMLSFAAFIFLNFLLFGLNITVIGLAIFSVINLLIVPGFDIGIKIFSMKYMGDITKDHDLFLSKIIFREFVFIAGRLIFILPFLGLFYSGLSFEIIMFIGILYSGVTYLIATLFVSLEEKRLKNIEIS